MHAKARIVGYLLQMYLRKSFVYISWIFLSLWFVCTFSSFFNRLLDDNIIEAFLKSAILGLGFAVVFSILTFLAAIIVGLFEFPYYYRALIILYEKGYEQISTENGLKILKGGLGGIKFARLPRWEEIAVIPGCSQQDTEGPREIFVFYSSYLRK